VKVTWTKTDVQAVRTQDFMRAFANLHRPTRNKLVALIRSTRPCADFVATFDNKRLSAYERKEGGAA
jgi:hypothetical protein